MKNGMIILRVFICVFFMQRLDAIMEIGENFLKLDNKTGFDNGALTIQWLFTESPVRTGAQTTIRQTSFSTNVALPIGATGFNISVNGKPAGSQLALTPNSTYILRCNGPQQIIDGKPFCAVNIEIHAALSYH